jgi:MFS family permease
VASILGAVGAGWALTIGWNFQQILLTAAVTAFPLWLLIAVSKFPTSGIIEEPAHPFATIGIIASNRSLAILGIVVIFATFAQNVGQTWSPIYLNTIGASPLISGIALASFQAATALFRFVNGDIVKSVGTRAALLSGALGMCIAAALLLYSQHQYVVLAAFVILGAAVAGAQPTTLAIAVRLMPTRIAVVSSGIMALGEVGFIMSTPILGWLGDTYSLQQSMATALPCGLLIMLLLFFLPKIPAHTKIPR